MSKSKFKSIRAKFVYFYLIPDIIENLVAINFEKNVDTPTKIDCDIWFYTQNKNAIVHLGIKKEDNSNQEKYSYDAIEKSLSS